MHMINDLTPQDIFAPSAALAASEDVRDCVTLLNGEGRVVQLSPGTLASFGVLREDDVIGRVWWHIWPLCAQAPLQEAVARAFKGHIAKYWTHFDHADGRVTEWDIRMTPLYDDARQINSVVVVSRNVAAH